MNEKNSNYKEPRQALREGISNLYRITNHLRMVSIFLAMILTIAATIIASVGYAVVAVIFAFGALVLPLLLLAANRLIIGICNTMSHTIRVLGRV